MCGKVAIAGRVNVCARKNGLATPVTFGQDACDARCFDDRACDARIEPHIDAGFLEHLTCDAFVDFGVDGRAYGIVVESLRHWRVPGRASRFHQAVDDFLRNPFHDLPLFDARKRFPQVVEAVQRGAAFDGEAAGITLPFNEHGLRALPG